MNTDNQLPQPNAKYLSFWQATKESPLRARCIRDNPPRKHVGFGKELKVGDEIEFTSVCWNGQHYEICVPKEISFYQMDYFELVQPESEFDRIVAVMDAPDYPSTCNNCGYTASNSEMQTHTCSTSVTDHNCESVRDTVVESLTNWFERELRVRTTMVCFPPLSGGGTGAQSEHVFDNARQCVYCGEMEAEQ
jgi:hypothetical protein